MEVKLAALVNFDFCHSSDREELEQSLEELYASPGNEYGGAQIGGGSWSRKVYGDFPEDVSEDFPEFRRVVTIIEPEVRHLLDVVTFAELSEDQVRTILEAEEGRAESFRQDLMESVYELLDESPTVVDVESYNYPMILYVEPEERVEIWDEDGELDRDRLLQLFEGNSDLFNRISFNTSGLVSLLGSEDIVAPQVMMRQWGRLTALNVSSTYERNEERDDTIIGPLWLRRLSDLKPYMRAYYWSRHRLGHLAEVDEQTHGLADLLKESGEADDLENLLRIETELEEIQERWTDVYTRAADELAELRTIFDMDSSNIEARPLDNEIPKRMEGGIIAEDRSLIRHYTDSVLSYLDRLEADLDRIGDKQNRITDFIHDKISVKATESNIQLQKDIKYLTKVLTGLTVALVILTLVMAAGTFL